MAKQKPILIVIPGLGDRVRGYSLLTLPWRLLGYDARIFSFRWEVPSEDFSTSFERLLDYVDKLDRSAYITGVSAGGSVAVNALQARPQAIQRVATVAVVFRYEPHLDNSKLKDSTKNISKDTAAKFNRRILSIYGLHDQTVPISSTRHLTVPGRQIPVAGHALIIFAGLTIYARSIHQFLNKNHPVTSGFYKF